MARSCFWPRITAMTILDKPRRAMTTVSKMAEIHSRELAEARTASAPNVEPCEAVAFACFETLFVIVAT